MRRWWASVVVVLGMAGLVAAGEPREADAEAFAANRRLGRGINLGNALEAPKEGEWGLTIREEYFDAIRRAGFDTVRLPVRWSAHAQDEAPYTIDPEFVRRVDQLLDQALSRGLNVVLNIHHYDELYEQPEAHRERFLALWRQIAERYRDRPGRLYFELLNEPHDPLTAERWNAQLRDALAVVRRSNPERLVIVGPVQWNSVSALPTLELPEDDRRLIATFHYYLPFRFTHQGASWAKGSDQWRGTQWQGTEAERQAALPASEGVGRELSAVSVQL